MSNDIVSSDTPQSPSAKKVEIFPGNTAFAPALLDPDLEVPQGIIGPDGNSPPKRFAVYRNNVVFSLMEAMGQTFPSTKIILGEENFSTVSRIYISNYPPKTAVMQSYGEEFPEFLKNFKPLENSPFLVDLANLEKFWLEAYHAPDALPLPGEALGAVDPELLMETKLTPHPAAFLVRSQFDLQNMFAARDHEAPENVNYEPFKTEQAILITRPAYDVVLSELSQSQLAFFAALFTQESLGKCVESAFQYDEEFDASAAITLMLTSGAISQISN